MNGQSKERLREFTVASVGLGVVLAVVFCAANAYLGLKAGMTVSASIPAAVVSMGLFKMIRRRRKESSLLESNLVQTITSTGETLAGGIIFTVPALVITKVWTGFDYWTVTLIAMTGGILGILFMIPLRRVLIADPESELTYPEGVACAEVLKSGERGGSGVAYIAGAIGVGALFKVLSSGVRVIQGSVEGALRVGRSGLYLGCDLSPALLGVGYIVGLNVSSLMFAGGAIGWLIGIPILLSQGAPVEGELLDVMWELWSTKIRYIGVGGMVVGGLWSIVTIRHGIARGVREVAARFSDRSDDGPVPRTERDMGGHAILILLGITVLTVFLVYQHLTGSTPVGLVATGLMVVTAFFFVAVSSYIAGLVGSSNTPWSGMTICTLLFAAFVLHAFGYGGAEAILATLGIAGVVCVAIANASDISQDLKTGLIVGATPRSQQWGEIIGAVIPAFFIAPILALLHTAYGIGTGGPESLQAPQAALFASLVSAIFLETMQLPKGMILIGAILAIVVIAADEALRRSRHSVRLHVMPVVVGIYLPLTLATPILLGGLLRWVTSRATRRLSTDGDTGDESSEGRGVLVSSGLIAGEAVTGILIAIPIALGVSLPIILLDSAIVSMLAFALLIGLFYRTALSRAA